MILNPEQVMKLKEESIDETILNLIDTIYYLFELYNKSE